MATTVHILNYSRIKHIKFLAEIQNLLIINSNFKILF